MSCSFGVVPLCVFLGGPSPDTRLCLGEEKHGEEVIFSLFTVI